MSPVEFKKKPCRPVEFKGQGPVIVLCNKSRVCIGDNVLLKDHLC